MGKSKSTLRISADITSLRKQYNSLRYLHRIETKEPWEAGRLVSFATTGRRSMIEMLTIACLAVTVTAGCSRRPDTRQPVLGDPLLASDSPPSPSLGSVPVRRPCWISAEPTGAEARSDESPGVQASYEYDERERLAKVDTRLVTEEGGYCWTESWIYDADHLVRHELLQHACVGLPYPPLDWYLDPYPFFDVDWSCYLPLGEPMPKVETWEYDDLGRLKRWTSTGWADEPWAECVLSTVEELDYEDDGSVEIRRWTRGEGEFHTSLPEPDCADAEEDCEDEVIEEQVQAWYAAGRALAVEPPTGSPVIATYELDEAGRVTSWRTEEGSGSLSWRDDGTLASLTSSTCSSERELELNAEGLVVAEQVRNSATPRWQHAWSPARSLVELTRAGEEELRFSFNDATEVGDFEAWGWSFSVSYCPETADPESTRLVPFTLASDPRTAVDGREAAGWLPSVLYLGLSTEPVAAPGVWGSGRPWNVLEPGGAAWGCARTADLGRSYSAGSLTLERAKQQRR